MTKSKEIILSKIRSFTKKEHSSLQLLSRAPQPYLKMNLIDLFIEKSINVSTHIKRLNSLNNAEFTIRDILQHHEMPLVLRASKQFKQATFPNLYLQQGPAHAEDNASLVFAFCAVAETGTLVILSGPENPTTLNFLPQVHIVLLATNDILPHYEDAWQKIIRERKNPRTIHFITGPSRTGDIAQTVQIGIHGPKDLYVLLYEKD